MFDTKTYLEQAIKEESANTLYRMLRVACTRIDQLQGESEPIVSPAPIPAGVVAAQAEIESLRLSEQRHLQKLSRIRHAVDCYSLPGDVGPMRAAIQAILSEE